MRLTPKSKRGLAASDPVDQLKVASYVLHYGISARPSLRACVSDFARWPGFRLRRLYLVDLRTTRKPRWMRLKSGVSLSRHAEQQ